MSVFGWYFHLKGAYWDGQAQNSSPPPGRLRWHSQYFWQNLLLSALHSTSVQRSRQSQRSGCRTSMSYHAVRNYIRVFPRCRESSAWSEPHAQVLEFPSFHRCWSCEYQASHFPPPLIRFANFSDIPLELLTIFDVCVQPILAFVRFQVVPILKNAIPKHAIRIRQCRQNNRCPFFQWIS